MPLGDDWFIAANELRPGLGLREYRCGFLKIDGTDTGLNQGVAALTQAVERVKLPDGSPAATLVGPDTATMAVDRPQFVAVVAAEVHDQEDLAAHQRRCFERLQVILGGLTLATNTAVPELTIERVWPLYLVGQSSTGQPVTISNLVLVEHGFGGLAPASDEQLQQAIALADARALGSPVETYRYFERRANTSAWHDGDYAGAVLNAAMATKILLKHTSWLLTWEATTQLDAPTPAPRRPRSGCWRWAPAS